MRSRTIKNYHYINLRTIIIAAVGIMVSGITIALFLEYRFFHQQAQKMLMVREEYQNHLVAMHKIIQEYNKTKERIEELESTVSQQKKKSREVAANASSTFPQGTKVFSSDEIVDPEGFLVINRNLNHLRQTSLKYLREHKLDTSLQPQHMDAWQGYTDQLTQRQQQQKSKKSRRGLRNKNTHKRRSRASAMPTYDEQTLKQYNDISLSWPINRSEFWLSSFFGPRRKSNGKIGFHYGIDMAAVRGTLVHPASHGVVVEAGVDRGYGKTVVIAHDNKYRTRYAHLDKINVRVGQQVTRETLLGKVGATGHVRSKHGRAGGSHLHFEVCVYGKRINPMYFFA